MIFVKGYGQMCNNILQYAHAYVWGKANGVRVISMRFAYKYRYFRVCSFKYHCWPVYLFAKLCTKMRLVRYFFLDDPKDVTPEVLSELTNRRMVVVDGWHFRFPELFLKSKEEIRSMFAFRPKIVHKVKQEFEKFSAGTDIRLAVHIRRGDYKNWMGGKYYFDDTVYIRYIRQFVQLFPGKKVSVFICTNDRHLKLDVYKQALGMDCIYLSKGNEAEDLCLLSCCDYIIGVKSTFSLVASFYHDRPLYWIMDKERPLALDEFSSFDRLFMSV